MRLLKHANNTDVAIEVLKRFYVKETSVWKLKVRWWNIGTKHEPWCMNIEQRIELTEAARRDWKSYR